MEVTKERHILEKRKSLMGEYVIIRHVAFFPKLMLLMISSCTFLFLDTETTWGKIQVTLILLIALLDSVLLKKQITIFLRFFVISSVVLIVVWCLFVRPEGGTLGVQTCIETLQSTKLYNSIFRLWGIFAVGLLFAGYTTQYEVLAGLKKYHFSVHISIFCILVWNAFACFIHIYKEISCGLDSRGNVKNPIKRMFYIITTMTFEAMQIIIECRKMFFLHDQRIYSSIRSKRTNEKKENHGSKRTINIHFSDIKYVGHELPLLVDAEIEAKTGDIILLTGENGCGKTTLLNLISGIIPEVLVASYKKISGSEIEPGEIGFVFQGINNYIFFETAETQLGHIEKGRLEVWLKKFALHYDDLFTRAIVDFSSGEQQKLSLLAELLDTSKTICLLDEPTAFLDENGKEIFFELLQFVKHEKIIIMISHDNTCIHFCNKHYQIIDKRLKEGIWSLKNDKLLVFAKKQINSTKIGDFSFPDLCKNKLELWSGDSICIIGENGAGKTTFAKKIFEEVNKSCSINCSLMLQKPEHQLFATTVLEELMLGKGKNKEQAYFYLEKVGMKELADEAPQFLSGGQKRILLILCMLMKEPELMILDEPLSFLDKVHAETVIQLLVEYYEKKYPCIIICDQTSSRFLSVCEKKICLNKVQR